MVVFDYLGVNSCNTLLCLLIKKKKTLLCFSSLVSFFFLVNLLSSSCHATTRGIGPFRAGDIIAPVHIWGPRLDLGELRDK